MIKIFKILSLSFFAIFLAGCNSNSELENQVDDLKQELAATEAELLETEAELEDQKVPKKFGMSWQARKPRNNLDTSVINLK